MSRTSGMPASKRFATRPVTRLLYLYRIGRSRNQEQSGGGKRNNGVERCSPRAALGRSPGANYKTSIQRSAATWALLSEFGLGPSASDEQRGDYCSRTRRTIDLALNLLDDLFFFDWFFNSRDHLGLPPCEWTIFFRPGFRKFTQYCGISVAIRHDVAERRGYPLSIHFHSPGRAWHTGHRMQIGDEGKIWPQALSPFRSANAV